MITILILPFLAMAPGMEFRSEKQKTIILLHKRRPHYIWQRLVLGEGSWSQLLST